jgi:CNT family concentrative nucleoside transporter
LIAEKVIIVEFVAFVNLGALAKDGQLLERSMAIAVYALCGFSNFASMGVQIAGLGSLVPNRRLELSRTAFKAMVCGNLVCFLTACSAGMVL